MSAIFASIIHKHDEIQRTLKIWKEKQYVQTNYALSCEIPDGQAGAVFLLKEMVFFTEYFKIIEESTDQ